METNTTINANFPTYPHTTVTTLTTSRFYPTHNWNWCGTCPQCGSNLNTGGSCDYCGYNRYNFWINTPYTFPILTLPSLPPVEAPKDADKKEERLGWQCPTCHRVWAPHVDECRKCNGEVSK